MKEKLLNLKNPEYESSKLMQKILKRLFDIILSILLVSLLSPLLLLICLFIKLTSKGPIFFRQERLGYKGTKFWIYKFRTMVVNATKIGTGLYVTEGDNRITCIGRILRTLHLDEIPQIINVLKGEMSFVGPRPAIPYHYDYYEEWEKVRLDVLPGITGWAQVHGANAINWDERIKLDIWYVNHWSVGLDLYIIFLTFIHILGRLFGIKKDTYSRRGPVWTRGRPDKINFNIEKGDVN